MVIFKDLSNKEQKYLMENKDIDEGMSIIREYRCRSEWWGLA